MKFQKASIFTLSLALCMTVGLFSAQVFSFAPDVQIAHATEDDEFVPGLEIDPRFLDEDGNPLDDAFLTEDGYLDIAPIAEEEIFDFDGDFSEGIEGISEDLESGEAELEADEDSAEIGWVPVAITVAGLFVAGAAAFFISTRKKKA
jgi:hypothetical protein